MAKKFIFLFMIALAIVAYARTSSAVLNAVGPVDPANGFPQWYQDSTGLALAPCLTENAAYCVVLADPGFSPLLPVVFPTNWPIEFFYYIADVDKGTAPAAYTKAVKIIRFTLEGSFANLPTVPVNGLQTVFARTRIIFTPPSTGAYTFTHPFGSKTYAGTAGVQIKDTIDVPLGVPLDFTSALGGQMGPFMQCADCATFPIVDPAGNQYIGDPLIGHLVTPGPNGNFVSLTGPNIGGVGINVLTHNKFLVSGKRIALATATPLGVTRTSYGKSAAVGTQVDVFATTVPAAAVLFNSIDSGLTATTAMTGDGSGRFFGESLPALLSSLTVTVDSVLAPNTPAIVPGNLIDVVTVTLAQYSLSTQTLTVQASTSDQVGAATLTALNLGDLTAGSLVMSPILAPPGLVTVSSSLGGKNSRTVKIVP